MWGKRRKTLEQQHAILEVTYQAAELTQQEAYVIRQRLLGRSFEEITWDRALQRPGHKRITKQALALAEARAMRKLEVTDSLDTIIRQSAAASRAQDALDRGHAVSFREMRSTEEPVLGRARMKAADIDQEEKRLDDWVDYLMALAAEQPSGRLTPAQQADFDRRIRAGQRPPHPKQRRYRKLATV